MATDILDILTAQREIYVLEVLNGVSGIICRTGEGIRVSCMDAKIDKDLLEFKIMKITPTFANDLYLFGTVISDKSFWLKSVQMAGEGLNKWLCCDLDTMAEVARFLGLMHIPFKKIPATVDALRIERDVPSVLGLPKIGIEVSAVTKSINGLFENPVESWNMSFLSKEADKSGTQDGSYPSS